jgi:inner membrane protein involved in colicin E2 resistance
MYDVKPRRLSKLWRLLILAVLMVAASAIYSTCAHKPVLPGVILALLASGAAAVLHQLLQRDCYKTLYGDSLSDVTSTTSVTNRSE